MKTSCWFTPKPAGHIGIGISRGVPKGYEHLPTYRALAPGSWFNSCPTPQAYADLYAEILAKLDPHQVVLDLQRLADCCILGETTVRPEPVLLCYEHPTSAAWCHRALVSAWLHDTLGLIVPELGHEHRGHGWQHPKLHHTLSSTGDGLLTQPRLPFGPSTHHPTG